MEVFVALASKQWCKTALDYCWSFINLKSTHNVNIHCDIQQHQIMVWLGMPELIRADLRLFALFA
jgi:hypothetical protein